MSTKSGRLYVVATPIGNLADWSPRAIEVLKSVDLIAAEDTRHSGVLLKHFGIVRPLLALHEHNERDVVPELVARMQAGALVAQISDAGTPMVSDPGFHLVRAAQEAEIQVIPIPGPSAVLAALAAAGLPTDRFVFEGFLPAKAAARRQRLEVLAAEPRTQVYFEAPHRVGETLEALTELFGPEREAALARELTKTFETIKRSTLGELSRFVAADANQRRGEIVLVVHGVAAMGRDEALSPESLRVLQILAEELPPSQAAALAAKITGVKKGLLYQQLLEERVDR